MPRLAAIHPAESRAREVTIITASRDFTGASAFAARTLAVAALGDHGPVVRWGMALAVVGLLRAVAHGD